MSEETSGLSRRDALKRGAILGGTVLWATPVVQTIGMTSASAQNGSPGCSPRSASSVESSAQGSTKGGGPFNPGRSTDTSALDPDGVFFSLGYGGSIVVEFSPVYTKGTGGELVITEITNQDPYPLETATVEVAETLGTWISLGVATNGGGASGATETAFSLDVPAAPSTVRYVRIVDTSIAADNDDPSSDGFDLDGVEIRCA